MMNALLVSPESGRFGWGIVHCSLFIVHYVLRFFWFCGEELKIEN